MLYTDCQYHISSLSVIYSANTLDHQYQVTSQKESTKHLAKAKHYAQLVYSYCCTWMRIMPICMPLVTQNVLTPGPTLSNPSPSPQGWLVLSKPMLSASSSFGCGVLQALSTAAAIRNCKLLQVPAKPVTCVVLSSISWQRFTCKASVLRRQQAESAQAAACLMAHASVWLESVA